MTTLYTRALTKEQIETLEQAMQDRTDDFGAFDALRKPVNGESLWMPIIASGWLRRAAALGLPKKGAKRDHDREAYMQGAMAALVVAGVMPRERADQIAFLTAVGRLPEYVDAQAAKDGQPG